MPTTQLTWARSGSPTVAPGADAGPDTAPDTGGEDPDVTVEGAAWSWM